MVVAGIPINFTDTSTGRVSVSWDFGDGTPSVTGSPVSHTYATAGTYRVTDTIKSSTGSTITCFQDIVVTAPTTGTLDVSSVPLGAEIFIDGTDQSKVTRSVIQNIPVGSHTLKLTLSNYLDYTTTFTITGGATTTLNPTLTRLIGTLDISSVPPGAEIFIDGVDQSKITRSVIQNIPVGSHSLKLTLAGYQDYTTTFTITAGTTTTLNPSLTPSMVCSFSYSQA